MRLFSSSRTYQIRVGSHHWPPKYDTTRAVRRAVPTLCLRGLPQCEDRISIPKLGCSSHLELSARMGYTHLIGGGKADRFFAERLEQRVAQDYPAHYDRICRFVRSTSE